MYILRRSNCILVNSGSLNFKDPFIFAYLTRVRCHIFLAPSSCVRAVGYIAANILVTFLTLGATV